MSAVVCSSLITAAGEHWLKNTFILGVELNWTSWNPVQVAVADTTA